MKNTIYIMIFKKILCINMTKYQIYIIKYKNKNKKNVLYRMNILEFLILKFLLKNYKIETKNIY